MASQEDATIDLMLTEAIKTNAIEGEDLDRESVRSSLLSLITSDTLPDNSDQKAAGAAMLLVDVRKSWQTSLTHDLLGKWQSMAVPEQRHTPVLRGAHRNNLSPMQIVSGPHGREQVHYEAPPATQVPEEMARYIAWYNKLSPSKGDKKKTGIARAGIAHLLFEVIHPFDDGNGRVGRVINAQAIAREEVDFVLAKTRFYEAYGDLLNERQARMVSRVFAEGRKGFEGGITTKKYEAITNCPNRTASRDLSDLVAKGIVMPLPGGGRTTRYELAVVEPAGFGLEKK